MLNGEKNNLLTWFDVERRIAQCTNGLSLLPEPILSVSTYSDSVEITMGSEAGREEVIRILKEWFTEAEFAEGDGLRIFLRIGKDSFLPVYVSDDAVLSKKGPPLLPLWRRLVYMGEEGSQAFVAPKPFNSGPRMTAFHSFKGGVGRTTSLMTFVSARIAQLAQNKVRGRILIIDGDIEAPGVTYWLSPSQRGTVSYIQLLEALHSPPSNVGDVLDYFSKELQKNAIDFEGTQLFVLPAFVDQTDLLNAKIFPEHLVRTPDDAWVLGDYLHDLGRRIDAEYVFIDLRAGLSELSSPVLFDPRFYRFVVTTIAEQSVRGVELLLRTLSQVWGALTSKEGAQHPCIVVSMLTDALRSSADYVDVRERLERAYAIGRERQEGLDSERSEELLQSLLTLFESGFSTDLMALRNLEHALSVVRRSSLIEGATAWFPAAESSISDVQVREAVPDLDEQAARLSKICELKQFAETQESSDLLITEALRNLGRAFAEEIPNAVLIGAKGSGKTFSFLQISYSKKWNDFLGRIDSRTDSSKESLVLPLLRSNELGDGNSAFVNRCFAEAQRDISEGLGTSAPELTLSEVQDLIERERAVGSAQLSGWISFWTSIMARSLGSSATTLSALNQELTASKLSVVFLFDGIEDVLRNVAVDDVQKAAVEAIIELPNRIRELKNPAIGVLAFVREDYAKLVKTQNFGQFESRYAKYRLDWSPREFLQLVLWLCAEANITWARKEEIDELDTEQIVERLEGLWGRKLGRDDAAEAYSARWVYAALSDLKGRLQARDAVRFLRFAAQQASSKRLSVWVDRVIPPSAIRGALIPTSEDKLREAVQEYESLKEWVEKLVAVDAAKKKIPFAAEDLSLDGRLRQALQEIGVIYEDIEKDSAERLYVPEIYRHGLGLASSSGARPRVQALLQRALGTLPF